jgi:hypothetical protein
MKTSTIVIIAVSVIIMVIVIGGIIWWMTSKSASTSTSDAAAEATKQIAVEKPATPGSVAGVIKFLGVPNKCMSVSGGIQGKGANGTPITLWDCPNYASDDPNLKFIMQGNQIVWINDGKIPNKCVSVSGGIQRKGASGTPMTLWDCPNNTSTDPNLQFKMNGKQIVWTGVPNKCVSVSGGVQRNGKNGTSFTIWDCPSETSSDPNLQFGW